MCCTGECFVLPHHIGGENWINGVQLFTRDGSESVASCGRWPETLQGKLDPSFSPRTFAICNTLMTVDYRYFVCLITGIVSLYFSHQEMNFSVSTFALCSTLMTVNDKYTFSSFNDLLITSIEFFFY